VCSEPDVVAETGFKRAVIIDNLPQVGPEKLDKLVGMVFSSSQFSQPQFLNFLL
jgi:hypothetical protein